MIVFEKHSATQHHPHWKYELGQIVHDAKDTPDRVKTIKNALAWPTESPSCAPPPFPNG